MHRKLLSLGTVATESPAVSIEGERNQVDKKDTPSCTVGQFNKAGLSTEFRRSPQTVRGLLVQSRYPTLRRMLCTGLLGGGQVTLVVLRREELGRARTPLLECLRCHG